MVRGVLLTLLLSVAFGAPVAAQAPAPPPAPEEIVTMPEPPAVPKTMTGTWEFSNADREKLCTIIFRGDAASPNKKVEFDRGCAGHFPFIKEIVTWTFADGDFLRLIDARGRSVLEFSEVEGGIFEAPRPGEGILFIQSPATAGPAPRTAEQMTGEWSIARAGRPICPLTLSNAVVGEEFAIQLKTPCDRLVTGFAPVSWSMERGELVMKSAKGQTWRFEPGEDSSWRRLPSTNPPVTMVRK